MNLKPMTRRDLPWLAGSHKGPCVSLYASLQRDGYRWEGTAQRLALMVKTLDQKLLEQGLNKAEAEDLLAPLQSLLGQDPRDLYAEHRGLRIQGLGVFAAMDGTRAFISQEPLPDWGGTASHFELRPFLAASSPEEACFVLEVSPKTVRLWHISDEGAIDEVLLPEEMPHSLRGYLEHTEFAPKLAYHATGSGAPGATVGKWYGTVARDTESKVTLDFALALAHFIKPLLLPLEVPVALAASEGLAAALRTHLKHPRILESTVPWHPDRASSGELARTTMGLLIEEERQKARLRLAHYREVCGTPRATAFLDDSLAAAREGRVDTLFAASPDTLPLYDPRNEVVSATIHFTLQHGGKVAIVDESVTPEGGPMGAILRWVTGPG